MPKCLWSVAYSRTSHSTLLLCRSEARSFMGGEFTEMSDKMTRMIDDVFKRKTIIPERLSEFGFQKSAAGYTYKTDFLDGAFLAVITIQNNKIDGHVIDRATGDEYFQIDVSAMQGRFVNSVRAAYQKVLDEIAENCCQTTPFASLQANRITALIKQKYHVTPDFPWHSQQNQANGVFRHLDSAKWFGLIVNIKRSLLTKDDDDQFVDVINLKSNSLPIDHKSVFPAYHMNHRYWISVVLDDRLDDAAVMKLIDESFMLTSQARKR